MFSFNRRPTRTNTKENSQNIFFLQLPKLVCFTVGKSVFITIRLYYTCVNVF